jgi:hypothetical protein
MDPTVGKSTHHSLPIPTGNVDDEGTLFALAVANITYGPPIYILALKLTESIFSTDAQARRYVHEKYMIGEPDAEVDRVMNLYPSGG